MPLRIIRERLFSSSLAAGVTRRCLARVHRQYHPNRGIQHTGCHTAVSCGTAPAHGQEYRYKEARKRIAWASENMLSSLDADSKTQLLSADAVNGFTLQLPSGARAGLVQTIDGLAGACLAG